MKRSGCQSLVGKIDSEKWPGIIIKWVIQVRYKIFSILPDEIISSSDSDLKLQNVFYSNTMTNDKL